MSTRYTQSAFLIILLRFSPYLHFIQIIQFYVASFFFIIQALGHSSPFPNYYSPVITFLLIKKVEGRSHDCLADKSNTFSSCQNVFGKRRRGAAYRRAHVCFACISGRAETARRQRKIHPWDSQCEVSFPQKSLIDWLSSCSWFTKIGNVAKAHKHARKKMKKIDWQKSSRSMRLPLAYATPLPPPPPPVSPSHHHPLCLIIRAVGHAPSPAINCGKH